MRFCYEINEREMSHDPRWSAEIERDNQEIRNWFRTKRVCSSPVGNWVFSRAFAEVCGVLSYAHYPESRRNLIWFCTYYPLEGRFVMESQTT